MFRTPGSRAVKRNRFAVHLQVFQATGTFTTPIGTTTSTVFKFRMVGGGGGGGGTNGAGAVGGGGAAGVYCEGTFTGVPAGLAIAITIGAAGAAGSAAGGAGGGGGDTIIGAPVSVTAGGSGGGAGNTAAGTTGAEGGSSGTATGPFTFSISGQHGGRGWSTAASFGVGGAGGSNPLGYGAIPGSLNVAQNPTLAVGFGAGGAGAFLLATAGSPGTAGAVIIEWVL